MNGNLQALSDETLIARIVAQQSNDAPLWVEAVYRAAPAIKSAATSIAGDIWASKQPEWNRSDIEAVLRTTFYERVLRLPNVVPNFSIALYIHGFIRNDVKRQRNREIWSNAGMLAQDIIDARWLIDDIYKNGITNPVAIAKALVTVKKERKNASRLPALTPARINTYLKGREAKGFRTGWDAILHREFNNDEALVLGYQTGFYDDGSSFMAGFITDSGEVAQLTGFPQSLVEVLQSIISSKLHKLHTLYSAPVEAHDTESTNHHALSASQIGGYLQAAWGVVDIAEISDGELPTANIDGSSVTESNHQSHKAEPAPDWWKALPAFLKPREVQVIRAKYGLGMDCIPTDNEIAAATGIERSTVTRLHNRALQRLRELDKDFITGIIYGLELAA